MNNILSYLLKLLVVPYVHMSNLETQSGVHLYKLSDIEEKIQKRATKLIFSLKNRKKGKTNAL